MRGEAVVAHEPVSFGYIDENGRVIDTTHHLCGEIVKDKILVMPTLKGSATQELVLIGLVQKGRAPKGIIAVEADTRLATSALFAEIPAMDKLETNPLEVINTGDIVHLNADKGFIEIKKRI